MVYDLLSNLFFKAHTLEGGGAGLGTKFLQTLGTMVDTLFPFAWWDPDEVNAAEKAAAGSSLETFLMTSIFEGCLALGGFSVKYKSGDTHKKSHLVSNTEKFNSLSCNIGSDEVETKGQTLPCVHLTNTLKNNTMDGQKSSPVGEVFIMQA